MEPSSAEQRLLAIHAHPDDESITTGGLLARCADAGVRTRLVTCTDGRYGPVNPGLGLTLTPEELAEVRRKELGSAAKVLGVAELDWLGYHDSGTMGSPNNQRPQAFWAEPLQKLVERVVRILRQFRPHMLVTYDPFGCTGHPDHIQAHRVALLAAEGAAEPHLFPDTGAPWTVSHVFYPVFPMSAMERFIDEELRAGRPHPFDGRSSDEINYTRRPCRARRLDNGDLTRWNDREIREREIGSEMPEKQQALASLPHAAVFGCPVCDEPLARDDRTFRCVNGHVFDVAREGYVNLLLPQQRHSKDPGYSKEMIAGRRDFFDAGHYQILADGIAEAIISYLPGDAERVVVDAGCGEGYYLRRLRARLGEQGKNGSTVLCGMDISTHAIRVAAKRDPRGLYAVAGTYRMPVLHGGPRRRWMTGWKVSSTRTAASQCKKSPRPAQAYRRWRNDP